MGYSPNVSTKLNLLGICLREHGHMNVTLHSGFPEDAGSVKCGMVFHPSRGCTAGGILAPQVHAKTRNEPKPVLLPPVHLLRKVRGDALVNKVVVEELE